MNGAWIFVIVVALLIGWFLLDRPVQPGETLQATIAGVKALPTVSGPPSVEVTLKLPDGASVLLKIEHGQTLDVGKIVAVRRFKRRLSGVASYEYVSGP
jgi:hypothetical protein